ncbi:hypothetical protein GC093_09720 [Paenibacillus sp. LMG 31456]|uniref:Nudix hydrolase domain-containing protein n=1 Tax=Paenibacillus foliorum TaxID=2654974 RepID=A0A972GS74_9BACL|nr:hypothetical protein [Paenibacillus foliorum]
MRETFEETGLEIELTKKVCELFNERINGNYYCYLGEVIGGNAGLGSDPELSDDAQELQELKWIPIKEMQGHPEVKRLLPYL